VRKQHAMMTVPTSCLSNCSTLASSMTLARIKSTSLTTLPQADRKTISSRDLMRDITGEDFSSTFTCSEIQFHIAQIGLYQSMWNVFNLMKSSTCSLFNFNTFNSFKTYMCLYCINHKNNNAAVVSKFKIIVFILGTES